MNTRLAAATFNGRRHGSMPDGRLFAIKRNVADKGYTLVAEIFRDWNYTKAGNQRSAEVGIAEVEPIAALVGVTQFALDPTNSGTARILHVQSRNEPLKPDERNWTFFVDLSQETWEVPA